MIFFEDKMSITFNNIFGRVVSVQNRQFTINRDIATKNIDIKKRDINHVKLK